MVTKTDASNNIYVAGSTFDTNNNLDIILQKFDPEGTLLWEETFNGDADSNDVTGDKASFSTTHTFLDFIAPGTPDIYQTVDYNDDDGYSYSQPGTSFAAAHVTGVCALLHGEHTVNNGYPNGLAPEDYEQILQKYATNNVGSSSGYDNETGFGRINAFGSLEKITMPEYFIKHSQDLTYNLMTEIFTDINITIEDPITGIPSGDYVANKHLVKFSCTDVLPTNQHIIDVWIRYSGSEGIGTGLSVIENITEFDFNPTVSLNELSGVAETYCWYITEDDNGQVVNKWYPAPPEDLKFAYSVHVKDLDHSSVDENTTDEALTIYPNPSNGIFNIAYSNNKSTHLSVEIVDIAGRIVYQHDLQQKVLD